VSRPRLYVPNLDPSGGHVVLATSEAHHVTRVLRLRPGAEVRVFDGRGREWTAHLVPGPTRAAVAVMMDAEVAAVPEPRVRVTLAAGLLKGDHMDAVIRDATMMGAAAIVPVVSEHVAVPQKAWKTGAAVERWTRVGVASAKQCGRAVVPDIAAPQDLRSVLTGAAAQMTVMFVEPSQGVSSSAVGSVGGRRPERALVLIGPEGGWSGREVEQARAAGATFAHLGPRTIRADAMAAVALSALWTVWGG